MNPLGPSPFPAGAGINRAGWSRSTGRHPIPRRRGDQPRPPASDGGTHARSPQARGSTDSADPTRCAAAPFPAGAGINRVTGLRGGHRNAVPRRRGDQPFSRQAGEASPFRSPQARGSTESARWCRLSWAPFPAGAGINRPGTAEAVESVPVPRRRGDQPLGVTSDCPEYGRSPQARGSTDRCRTSHCLRRPFPAGAGINRMASKQEALNQSVPRRRGDQPHIADPADQAVNRSPQARGSTARGQPPRRADGPFPAGAGINRCVSGRKSGPCAVPRRRGDQPRPRLLDGRACYRSPQARGSTGRIAGILTLPSPFPAGAGINRRSARQLSEWRSVPRRCGDQPPTRPRPPHNDNRSPQTRGFISLYGLPSKGRPGRCEPNQWVSLPVPIEGTEYVGRK